MLQTRARLALITASLSVLALTSPVFAAPAERGMAVDSKSDPGPAIKEVRLRVDDFKTKKDLGYMLEGDVLELAPGDSVIVRVVAIPAAEQRAVRYPEAKFKLLSGARRIDLSRHNEKYGSVVVHAVRPDDPANPSSVTLVEFTITSPLNASKKLLGGTFSVVVKTPQAPAPDTFIRAEEITASLYRAILLREPDAGGAASKIAVIRRDGYPGILAVAEDMAASPESREDVYRRSVNVTITGRPISRPVNNEDRLLAMYRELLGIGDTNVVRAEVWNRQLDALSRGEIAQVVRELLARGEFGTRFDVAVGVIGDRDRAHPRQN